MRIYELINVASRQCFLDTFRFCLPQLVSVSHCKIACHLVRRGLESQLAIGAIGLILIVHQSGLFLTINAYYWVTGGELH